MPELTPEDQAVLDAAEAWRESGRQTDLCQAVDARRKAREPKRCKHCGKNLTLCRDGGYWLHIVEGVVECDLVAEPDDSPAVEAR